jgi:SAM-dependent methyltransferase
VFHTLHLRPRGKPLATLLAQVTRGRVPPPSLDRVRRERTLETVRAYEPPRYVHDEPVTRDLLERLDGADVEAVVQRLDAETRAIWEGAPEQARGQLTLIFAACHHVHPVLERTGLRVDMPPDDVHAMARGPLAAGGDFWTADLIAEAALRHGFGFADGAEVLDFGCSTARHLRVLQAWRPGVRWLGCDPNGPAIAWVAEHLPGLEVFVSPQDPPMALGDGSLDAVFAVSVWSHFGPRPAERWLAEMHRLVRPGGLLIFTTQGIASVAHYLRHGTIDEEYAVSAVETLLASGHAYVPAFGPGGDWGVEHVEWGTAYLTLEWLANAARGWSIESFEAARVDANQNLVVLRRR